MKPKAKTLALSAWVLVSSLVANAEALLPPFYESVNEYKALLVSPELSNILGSGEAIRDIQRDDKGFVVTSTKYKLKVDVVYEPLEYPGPAKYHFVFHKPEAI